jgi:hypothetical protein
MDKNLIKVLSITIFDLVIWILIRIRLKSYYTEKFSIKYPLEDKYGIESIVENKTDPIVIIGFLITYAVLFILACII